jgi:hypothetical protein
MDFNLSPDVPKNNFKGTDKDKQHKRKQSGRRQRKVNIKFSVFALYFGLKSMSSALERIKKPRTQSLKADEILNRKTSANNSNLISAKDNQIKAKTGPKKSLKNVEKSGLKIAIIMMPK